jgi:L-fuconolactonase
MIDAHHHIWRIGEHGQVWPTPNDGVLYRTVTTAEYEALARAVGVTGSVLVQSQPCDEDTDFLTQLGMRCGFVKGIVGWADLKAADAIDRIEVLAGRPKLRGLRPMLQSLPDDWLDDAALTPAIRAMIDRGLRFDALILPHQLAALTRFCHRFPDLRVVVDHGAKPRIGSPDHGDWFGALAGISDCPNVHCKLSGLMTEAGTGAGREVLAPYVDHILSVFGPSRTMWGSDWPVIEATADYGRWFELARDMVPEAARHDVFLGSATAFYGLRSESDEVSAAFGGGVIWETGLHA